MKKQILALAMAVILLAGILPAASFAEEPLLLSDETTAPVEAPVLLEETPALPDEAAPEPEADSEPEAAPCEIPGYTPQGHSYDTEITQEHKISSADALRALYDYVAAGNSTAGHCYTFTADITLPADWQPIGILRDGAANPGNGKNILPFSGVINGAGHTLTVAEGGRPLLGYVRDALVCNLNLYGREIAGCGLVEHYVVDYGPDGSYSGKMDNTVTFFNVTILSGTATAQSGFLSGYASGINAVYFIDCTVEPGVTIGYDRQQSDIGSFGGKVNGYVINCVSYADVYGVDHVGGMLGLKSQAMGPCSVSDSAFHGSVTASGNYAGGIVGSGYDIHSAPNTPGVCIEDCECDGSITGADCVGGILGGEPAMEQCWDNGIGYIRNNRFTGTVKATSGSKSGGVIGYMKSLNRYNVIENNRYSAACGAKKGIGQVLYVDTSRFSDETDKPRGWVDGTYYMNTAEDSLEKIKADTNPGGAYYNISKKDHNRTDDPLGADAENLTRMDSVTVSPAAVKLTVSGSYKTVYTVGEALDLTGMRLILTYDNGAEEEVRVSDSEITGFDSSAAGTKTLTIRHSNVTAFVAYTVKNVDKTIRVTVSVLGDSAHGDSGAVHTLAGGGLKTWVPAAVYAAQSNDTVWDVLQRVFAEKGLTCGYTHSLGTVYIQSVTCQGVTVAEFTNGKNSGWMYTLNGIHPELGVAQQGLKDGDVIVLHYTDDYTAERTGFTGTTAETPVKKTESLPAAEAPPAAAPRSGWEAIYQTTGDYLEKLGTPKVGSIGGEWMVIGLARSGRAVPDGYYNSVLEYIREHIDEHERLHAAKSTDNSRLILALTAIGKDVTDIDGHNLLAGLTDMEFVQYQGINGPIWALIAFDSGNYPIPETGDVSREALLRFLLDAQLDNGGWALSGDTADADMTGMALQALAPYYGTDREVEAAVDKGVLALSEMQSEDGGYCTNDGMGGMVATSESVSQVIVALTALGIDPHTDERFVKNGSSALDALLSYCADGGFRHLSSGNPDGMATEQGYYALTAYARFQNGQSALYDMTDIIDMDGEEHSLPTETLVSLPVRKEISEAYGYGTVGVLLLGIMAGVLLGLILGIGMSVAVVWLYANMKKRFEGSKPNKTEEWS